LRDLLPLFRVEKFKKDEDIVRYGEKGDKFFIILSGEIDILIPNPLVEEWRTKRL
jgi:CRP-like cAMP-binding protein